MKREREGGIDVPVEQIEKELFTSESRRVDAEFRRLDSEIAGVKKSQEKFETKTEKAINDLRLDMNSRFNKVDARLDKMDARLDKMDARFDKMDVRFDSLRSDMYAGFEKLGEKMDGNFKATVTIFLTAMGIVLAAFYAFVSYMAK
jgi:iron uptake system EfeUOB component EfeO/EfeM